MYLPSYETRDLDYAWADREVDTAIRDLTVERPGLVPSQQVGVYFAPDDYEERLACLHVPGLVYLQVEVPEEHDLAIMKLTRGYERDVEAIEAVHQVQPLDLATVVERYEGTWLTGSQRVADTNFCNALAFIFGDAAAADDAMQMLADLRARKTLGSSRRRHRNR